MKAFKRPQINDFLLIIIGFFFFLNPMVVLFDFIPDFIGCLLMMLALHRLACLSSDFEDSFKYLKYMLLASLARLFVSLVSSQFDDVTLLSVSLIFAIAEAITAYLALAALCEGLSTLNYRYAKNTKQPIELRNIGATFFAVRGICSMLPYITSVLDGEDDTLITYAPVEQGDLTMLLTFVNIIITIIFACFLAATVIKHLGAYVKNREVRTAVQDEIKGRRVLYPEFFTCKNLVFCISLLAYSSLFLLDFIASLPTGAMNFIPDFIFAATAIWVIIMLKKQLTGYIFPLISGVIYLVLSVISYFVYNDFLSKHFATDIEIIIKRFIPQYITAIAFSFAETVALIAFAIAIVRYLMPLATHHSLCEYTAEFTRLGQKTERERTANRRLMIGFGIFLCVIALSGTALPVLLPIFDVGYDDINFPYLLAHIALHITFYAYSSSLFLRLRAGVVRRYTPAPERWA